MANKKNREEEFVLLARVHVIDMPEQFKNAEKLLNQKIKRNFEIEFLRTSTQSHRSSGINFTHTHT